MSEDRIDALFRKIGTTARPCRIGALLDGLAGSRDYKITVNQSYQRGSVWTKQQQERWVGFILQGGLSPAIYLYEDQWGYGDSLVDGQQRLHALGLFCDGHIGAELNDGSRTEFGKLIGVERLTFRALTIPVVEISKDTDLKTVLNLYLSINTEGTPHTQADLDKARALMDDL